jgi:hypothetical protein
MASPRIFVSCVAAYGWRPRPPGFHRLKRSCRRHGVELASFGRFTTFQNCYLTKLVYLGQCLEAVKHRYEFVLNIDASDTLLLRPLDGVLDYVRDRMLFCAERNCFPLTDLADRMPVTGSSYNFLNAGGFIAPMRVACSTINEILDITRHLTCDQAAWSMAYLNGLVDVDHRCQVFQSLWGVGAADVQLIGDPPAVLNVEHDTRPFVLHANGSSKRGSLYRQLYPFFTSRPPFPASTLNVRIAAASFSTLSGLVRSTARSGAETSVIRLPAGTPTDPCGPSAGPTTRC